MIDPKLLKDDPETVRKGLAKRRSRVDLDAVLAADEHRRRLQMRVDELRALKNSKAEMFGRHKRDKTAESSAALTLMEEMKKLDQDLPALEQQRTAAEESFHALNLRIPNMPLEIVPPGASSADNVELRRWGTPRTFTFSPKPHWEVGENLGILDMERAAKIAGSRFPLLTGAGARLSRALIQYMLDLHTTKHGYTEVAPPLLTRTAAEEGAGHLPFIAEDMYHLPAPEDLWLIGTSEVSLLNIHREEILEGARLPVKYVAYTPCFRKEAGAAGKDTRGLIRVHQFDKVEMFQFVRPEDSAAVHEEMIGHAEAVLQGLNLPYRLMHLCAADISSAMARTCDPEVWLPGQNEWREISSISNATDFQARRAQVRFKRDPKAKVELVHTLNGSGLAVGRTFVAILENYQEADGSITVPDALRPYMGGATSIAK